MPGGSRGIESLPRQSFPLALHPASNPPAKPLGFRRSAAASGPRLPDGLTCAGPSALALHASISARARKKLNAQRDRLIHEHIDWATRIAQKMASKLPSPFDVSDLQGAAHLGLLQAATVYDPTRLIPFRSFARRYVAGRVVDSVRRRNWREAMHGEVMLAVGVPSEQTLEPEAAWLKRWLGCLPPRNREVIVRIYWLGQSLSEIARTSDVGPSRLCQLHQQGLQMLREMMTA